MTIATPIARNNYVGNGATSLYAYSFYILDASHLEVWVQGDELTDEPVKLTLNTDYTVSGVQALLGGNVTLLGANAPLPLDYKLTIRRVVPFVQPTSIRDNSQYFAWIHENTFDYITMILQQVQDVVSRTFHFQPTSTLQNVSITDIVPDSVPVADAEADQIVWTPRSAFKGDKGDTGDTGPEGPEGNASRWYVQAGAPDNGVGVNNDMSLNSSNGDVYRKILGVWVLEANIAGPAGPAGFGDLNPSPLQPSGTTQTVNWGTGNFQNLELGAASGDVTLTLSSPSVGPSRYTIFIRQGVTPRDVIWPSSVKFPQGQKPILSQSNNAIDKVELLWDGANYYGDWNNDYQTSI